MLTGCVLCAVWALGQDVSATQPQPPLNPTQEVAGEQPQGPAIAAGPAKFRIGGYLGVTGIYRSTNSGGGSGTSFASIPYTDIVQGNVSEARLTAQSSRLSLRVDAEFPEERPRLSRLAGYFEVDFNGATSGNVAVSSTGAGVRLRHVFGEVQHRGKFLIAAGQGFSLMTATKDQLSIWPADYELTQAVDVNYLAGMIWTRIPQVRFTYRPSRTFNWAFSAENPEQQLGKGIITLPACCAADLDAQYNTGGDELKVPNLMPDFVTRVALNRGRSLHIDAGGVLRVFRHTLAPYDRDVKQVGGGVSVAAQVNPATPTKIVLQAGFGSGMGRYVGGLVPDVAITASGAITPVRTTSWVGGVEQKLGGGVSIAGYYSGVSTRTAYSLDTDGGYIGFGYPGSPNSNNRYIHEVTAVMSLRAWQFKDRGSMQWNTQVSGLRRAPWSQGAGPASASAFLFFSQLRYNLP